MKPILFITQQLPEQAVADLHDVYEVRMWPEEERNAPREKLLEEAKEAQALWTMLGDEIDRELFESAPNLKIVVNLAVGYNNIDLDAAREHKVIVTNTPDVLTETTADLTFALMLATARRLIEAEKTVRSGEWQAWTPMGMTGQNAHGSTVGIIGMGRIGEAVCRRAQGFNMEVIYHNRTRKSLEDADYAELDDLLKHSDFVVILAPLTEQTKGMVGERELSLMKETAILINCSRGGIVDEHALYVALKNKSIWGAGLDVFEQEPLPLDHPLQTLDNLTVTPHIGSATVQTRYAMMELNKEALQACANKKPVKNRVC
ncbi:D-glycerate dehydrogenase [Planococcus sp. CP5-4]|uniref:2-hydroxyacid dehydrogenase n=1 Tax=unclassified Planococcus (in: firmicutes) TaxID=2662419 RepID=UPI001C238889|nr:MULTISPECIES: D-glycerate dehydrogenase [unclassified Planococcus (in: firmicutes)]MBU9673101.1 D-glycerate dehydrogenase [Planococcus sp. CP5-4_YE]MBV0908347.1 D-glycerate dehydrogenase [Planococcus sp. CP5-4_UN]MBW6062409.1 D-glycerate dehydrogenase [Planococcus sp. CP5-4]